jgi:hypothetical protein
MWDVYHQRRFITLHLPLMWAGMRLRSSLPFHSASPDAPVRPESLFCRRAGPHL